MADQDQNEPQATEEDLQLSDEQAADLQGGRRIIKPIRDGSPGYK